MVNSVKEKACSLMRPVKLIYEVREGKMREDRNYQLSGKKQGMSPRTLQSPKGQYGNTVNNSIAINLTTQVKGTDFSKSTPPQFTRYEMDNLNNTITVKQTEFVISNLPEKEVFHRRIPSNAQRKINANSTQTLPVKRRKQFPINFIKPGITQTPKPKTVQNEVTTEQCPS